MLGNCRATVVMFDNTNIKRMAIIRGKLRKKVWINQGDIILISLRDYEENVDVIYKYTADEARALKSYGMSLYCDAVSGNTSR
jgi:translation initiation factor 1A